MTRRRWSPRLSTTGAAIAALATFAALLGVQIGAAAPAEAATACESSLVWSGNDGVSRSIYVADASGAGRLRISAVDAPGNEPIQNDHPQWRPVAPGRIAWDGFDDPSSHVYAADANGLNRAMVSGAGAGAPLESLNPQWSADGTRIAWDGIATVGTSTRQIYVASADGSGRTQISDVGADPDPTNNIRPQWRPDGTRVLWEGLGASDIEIYVADADGANRSAISTADADPDPTDNVEPQWSPDGTRVAWRSGADETNSQIYVADDDGLNRGIISDVGPDPDPTSNRRPQWSPDGTRIAWSGVVGGVRSIVVADPDGNNRVVISPVGTGTDPTDNVDPQWSPNSTRIAWSGLVGTTRSIFVANADGTGRQAVSEVSPGIDPTDNRNPEWSPCAAGLPPQPPGPTPTPAGACPNQVAPFTDTSTSFARADIDCMWAVGVVNGFTTTTYVPGGLVNREQMAAFLARLWRNLA